MLLFLESRLQERKHWGGQGATAPPVFWLLVLSHATFYHVTINNGPPQIFRPVYATDGGMLCACLKCLQKMSQFRKLFFFFFRIFFAIIFFSNFATFLVFVNMVSRTKIKMKIKNNNIIKFIRF